MALSLADLLKQHFKSYAEQYPVNAAHYRAVRAVLSCRTPVMGGHLYACSGCRKKHFAYHSCNHRSCPQCGSSQQAHWSAKQEVKLLPDTTYYMVTFTVPAELRASFLAHPRLAYDGLMKASAEALKNVIATKYNNAIAGFISVLHTWGRQIQHHPHVHSIVPAVAFNIGKSEVLTSNQTTTFLVHYKPLAQRFRTLMRAMLQEIQKQTDFRLSKEARIALSGETSWNVQVKPVGEGKAALRYLARYVQRSAFSPQRLLGYDAKGNVRVSWTDSNTGRKSVMSLHPHEFIRRWLIHVLPKGLMRVRHYGFLSPAAKKTRLIIRALLGELGEPDIEIPDFLNKPHQCSECGCELTLVKTLKRIRPPPWI